MTDRFSAAIRGPALVLDAAMGTRLIALGLRIEDDDPALWNLSRPHAVAQVHFQDVNAGADAVVTNTFGASRAWLHRFGRADDVVAINREAVGLARAAAGSGRLVVGSIGPATADDPAGALEQADVLAEAGVDALLFETFRSDDAERLLRTIARSVPRPWVISLCAWPDAVAVTARRLAQLGASGLGANCQDVVENAAELARSLRRATPLPLWIKPSAGLPGSRPASPERFAAALAPLADLRPILVGGCCGTTESYVALLRAAWYPGADKPTVEPAGARRPRS